MERKVKIYVLCYDDKSHTHATFTYKDYSWARILRIDSTKELENIVYLDWLEKNKNDWMEYDFIGTLSWIANKKIDLRKVDRFIRSFINGGFRYKNEKVQFVPFFEINISKMSMLDQSTLSHTKFREIWNELLKNEYSEEVINSKNIPFFACNYWMASKDFMTKYCEFQKKIKEKIDSEELQPLMNLNSNYKGNITKERLIEIFGFPYYTYHPFVYERLIGFFVFVNNDSIKCSTKLT